MLYIGIIWPRERASAAAKRVLTSGVRQSDLQTYELRKTAPFVLLLLVSAVVVISCCLCADKRAKNFLVTQQGLKD